MVSLLSDRQTRATEIYRAAKERPAGERDSYAAGACGSDDVLFAMVKDMMSADSVEESGATRVLDSPLSAPAAFASGLGASTARRRANEDLSGYRIGAYELLRRIGKGGMGSVYAARRVDREFRRLVALKFIKPGMETEEILLRFKNERQVLAGLDHPNISRLLDGGTDQGVPYLVMEYVEGTPIDEYCKTHRLSVRERLELFCTVCSAVQYAHQSLVVHRDIKPSNILVTSEGAPKLLDFGIAKVLRADYGETRALTSAAGQPMTPDFASPEQVRGDPITTSSDIYALGVLLHELLTTVHPLSHLFKKMGFERAVLDTEPDPPSVAVMRADPDAKDLPEGSREKLRNILKGDLDCIILMALRKEPQRRYASVQHFADDIHRYLNSAPVRAQRDTFRYRAGKFVRRHTFGVLAATAATLALIASSIISYSFYRQATKERVRAEARFSDVRELARFVLFDFDKSITAGTTPARKAVIEKATEYLDKLEKDRSDDASLERELVEGYLKVGDLQGNLYGPNLGDPAAARASYSRALKVIDSARSIDPLLLAQTRVKLADLIGPAGGAFRDAIEPYEKARQVFLAASKDSPEARRSLVDVLRKLAFAQVQIGDYTSAAATYEEFLSRAKELEVANPGNPEARRNVALGELRLGEMRCRNGDLASGLPRMEQALATYDELAAQSPHSASAQRGVFMASAVIGDALVVAERYKEAVPYFRRSLNVVEALAQADPRNEQFQRDLSNSLDRLAGALERSGELREAREMQRRALAILSPLVHKESPSELDLQQYAYTLLTTPFDELRNPAAAKKVAERLVAMTRGQSPQMLDLLALSYAGTGDFQRAIETENNALALLPPEPKTDLRKELETNLAGFRSGQARPARPKH